MGLLEVLKAQFRLSKFDFTSYILVSEFLQLDDSGSEPFNFDSLMGNYKFLLHSRVMLLIISYCMSSQINQPFYTSLWSPIISSKKIYIHTSSSLRRTGVHINQK